MPDINGHGHHGRSLPKNYQDRHNSSHHSYHHQSRDGDYRNHNDLSQDHYSTNTKTNDRDSMYSYHHRNDHDRLNPVKNHPYHLNRSKDLSPSHCNGRGYKRKKYASHHYFYSSQDDYHHHSHHHSTSRPSITNLSFDDTYSHPDSNYTTKDHSHSPSNHHAISNDEQEAYHLRTTTENFTGTKHNNRTNLNVSNMTIDHGPSGSRHPVICHNNKGGEVTTNAMATTTTNPTFLSPSSNPSRTTTTTNQAKPFSQLLISTLEKVRLTFHLFDQESQKQVQHSLDLALGELQHVHKLDRELYNIRNEYKSLDTNYPAKLSRDYYKYQEVDRNLRLIEGDLNEVQQQIDSLLTTRGGDSAGASFDLESHYGGGLWPDSNWKLPLFHDNIKYSFFINYGDTGEDTVVLED